MPAGLFRASLGGLRVTGLFTHVGPRIRRCGIHGVVRSLDRSVHGSVGRSVHRSGVGTSRLYNYVRRIDRRVEPSLGGIWQSASRSLSCGVPTRACARDFGIATHPRIPG